MIIKKKDLFQDIDKWRKELRRKIFIHPTDTIYGIGGNATSHKVVESIRNIKNRPINPFNIIAPSKEWIRKNFYVDERIERYLKKLPGPYTLILPIKNEKAIASNVAPGLRTAGVRIPDHWISSFVEKLGFPIITTSVNKTGEEYMTCLRDLDPEIREKVDYIIYEGVLKGKPSTLIHLERDRVVHKRRK